MSASKTPVRGPKSSPTDGDPDGPQHPMGEPPALNEPHPDPILSPLTVQGPWALPVGPEQISWDALVDHTLLQAEAHHPRGGGLGRNRRAIARITAQARIKRYITEPNKTP